MHHQLAVWQALPCVTAVPGLDGDRVLTVVLCLASCASQGLSAYPFGRVRCELELGSWSYGPWYVNVTVKGKVRAGRGPGALALYAGCGTVVKLVNQHGDSTCTLVPDYCQQCKGCCL